MRAKTKKNGSNKKKQHFPQWKQRVLCRFLTHTYDAEESSPLSSKIMFMYIRMKMVPIKSVDGRTLQHYRLQMLHMCLGARIVAAAGRESGGIQGSFPLLKNV